MEDEVKKRSPYGHIVTLIHVCGCHGGAKKING